MTTVTINGHQMGSILDLADKLKGLKPRPGTGDGGQRFMRFDEVKGGPELQRILEIERRPIPDPHSTYAKDLAAWMTRRLARVTCPYPLPPGGSMFPTQAFALKEVLETGCLAGPIRVGGGKMLLAYLIFAVLKAKRPLYMLPKSMLKETQEQVLKYSADWRGPPASSIAYLSYQKLSSPSSSEKRVGETVIRLGLLERLKPDVIVLDEAQWLSTRGAIGMERMDAYKKANPDVKIITLSGSYLRESINNAAHMFHWSLGGNAPVPNDWAERLAWSAALDEKPGAGGCRPEWGDLLKLLSESERASFDGTDDPDEKRAVMCGCVGRLILETPGVVGSQDGPLGIPLSLDAWWVKDEDPKIEEELRLFMQGDKKGGRAKWSLGDGEDRILVVDSLGAARRRYTMALGFWQKNDPPPPPMYLKKRLEWAKCARDRLKHNHLNIDSEANLKEAILAGAFKDLREPLAAWNEQQRLYTERTGFREPPSVATWFSDEVIQEVARWLDEQGTGIVWVNYIELGQRLSKELGIAYFGAGKVDATGRTVTEMRKGEPVVCSIGACGTGTNLQHFHSKGLWLGSPSEQPLGRTHRPGQLAERVENWVYLPGRGQLERYWKKYNDAKRFAEPLTRQAQKIVHADSNIPTIAEAEAERWRSYRWVPTQKKLDDGD